VAGDDALRATGEILMAETRAMNLVARYGGDEFVAVLSDTDRRVPTAMPSASASGWLDIPRLGPLGLTLSSGVAEFEDGMEEVEDLLRAADEDLYRNKSRRPGSRPLVTDGAFLSRLLATAETARPRGRRRVTLGHFGSRVADEAKADGSPVTVADREAERSPGRIRERFPDPRHPGRGVRRDRGIGPGPVDPGPHRRHPVLHARSAPLRGPHRDRGGG
jgi:GGDEF domain-containing protein